MSTTSGLLCLMLSAPWVRCRSTCLCLILPVAALPLTACRPGPQGGEESSHPPLSTLPPASNEGIVFTDVTQDAGIHFVHSFGDDRFSNLVEAVGSGAAFFDYDGDGWLDVYLATGKNSPGLNQGQPARPRPLNRLYRNRHDGTFEDVTNEAGVGAENLFSMGITVGDYNADGHPDLYICGFGRSLLFRNNGDGTFTDATRRAGVANEKRCAAAAIWLDYNRDGFPDLYVANYVEFDPNYDVFYAPDGFPGPLSYRAQPDRLYRNLGDGSFQDASEEVGVAELEGRGMSVASLDYDEDGYPDLYVTNDASENFLLHNKKGKRFEQVGLLSGVAYNAVGNSTASMGADFGDYDGDGRIDLFVSDDAISSLYHNQGDGFFIDEAVESGIARGSAQFVGWGSFFFDYDNDGDLDIFKVNSDLSRLFGQEDQVFDNQGDGKFQDVSDRLGSYFQRELLGRGACYGDYDNDGDLDVLISNVNGAPVLLRNDGGNRNHWIEIRLVAEPGHADALGTRLELQAGGRTRKAFKKGTSGYLSQSDPRLHFGLGEHRRVERIAVKWSCGRRQVLRDVAADQILVIREASDRGPAGR
ncbi:MAG: CRTAC1 family protein [Acidobacteriota bacterium]